MCSEFAAAGGERRPCQTGDRSAVGEGRILENGEGDEAVRRESWSFDTRVTHLPGEPDPATGAVTTPIYQVSTFALEPDGTSRGFTYSRLGNPTRSVLERTVASLEGAAHGFAFASGVAAEDAVLRLLVPGDHVVVSRDVYGGTYRLLSGVHARSGVDFSAADLTDPADVEAHWRDETRLLWIETPTNPSLDVVDIAELSALAHRRAALCVVDNTFASPYLQRPIHHGADLVVHSTTKYLGGHSDVIGGFVAVGEEELAERIAFVQAAVGAIPGPFECFLVLRGIKTLAVRMERHCDNAVAVARALVGHPAVGKVLYPGLADHPGHAVAVRQMRRFGGMVSFTVRDGPARALSMVGRTRLFLLANSLGGVESLIGYPATMSHASMAGSEFAVDPALVRLSVGIEGVDDLLDDLLQALGD
ncbi:MAG: cystathionine gamma-synthase [Acidimicrobiia bacterium]